MAASQHIQFDDAQGANLKVLGTATLFEDSPSGSTVTSNIQTGSKWGVDVAFALEGANIGWIDGDFKLELFLEGMGKATADKDITPPVTIPVSSGVYDSATGRINYTKKVEVAASSVPAGTYLVVGSISHDPAPPIVPGLPAKQAWVSGYCELKFVRFYDL